MTNDLVIQSLDGFLGLKFLEVTSGVHPIFGYTFTKYQFHVNQTTLKVSLVSRTRFKSRGFSAMISRGLYQYFVFDDYLKFIHSPDLKLLSEIELNDNDDEAIRDHLALLKKYLEGDLRKVFESDEWINVPFERY